MNIILNNKKSNYLYNFIAKYEAGIQLKGFEVKAIREGNVNIAESYITIKNNEIFVIGMHIGEYSHSGYATHDPTRERKLLMHKVEISKIKTKFETKGIAIIPLKLYFKNGKAKLEIALAKGKKKWDKRETIKKRDIDREIKISMKGN
jgi:SsrA-binding protein|tara:strand:- start:411 stop:854 length:444 start_codon:yes stop_codon:yes gene_type:complete